MPKTTKKTAPRSVGKTVKRTAAKSVKSAMATGQMIEEKAVKVAKKTNAFAKKNPWAVAGIAAGIGMGLGLLARGGKKKTAKKKR